MKRITNLLILLSVVVISCSEEQTFNSDKSLADSFFDSEVFSRLGVDVADLDVKNASISQDENQRFSIVVQFKSNPLKFVSGQAIKQKTYHVKMAYSFEYITNLSNEELTSALRTGQYSDRIEMNIFDGTSHNIQFENGKLDMGKTKFNHSGKTATCSSNADRFAQQVANCAARRIEEYNFVDATFCIASLPACWGQNLLSCMADGCPWI